MSGFTSICFISLNSGITHGNEPIERIYVEMYVRCLLQGRKEK